MARTTTPGSRETSIKLLPIVWNRLRRWAFLRRAPMRVAITVLRPRRGRRFPGVVQIEATSRCNLSCPACSHAKEETAGQHLAPDGLGTVLDALPRRPRQVILSGIGEPLVNPHFFALVDLLAQRRIGCAFFTNGTLLRPETRQAILARDNIRKVAISCDGAREETFESLRRGADFRRWKESVGLFLAEAKQRRRGSLELVANVLVCRQNLVELPDIIRLAAELGFDSVNLLDPIPVDEIAASMCPTADELGALLDDGLLGLARQLNFRVDWCLRRPGSPPRSIVRCVQPWDYVFIRANGAVAPCCAVFGSGQAAVMGNIFQQPFGEIWRGEPYREFRRTCASGTNPLCRVCPYY